MRVVLKLCPLDEKFRRNEIIFGSSKEVLIFTVYHGKEKINKNLSYTPNIKSGT